MILLIHQKGKTVAKVLKDNEEIAVASSDCIATFWDLAEKHPSELIIWLEEAQQQNLNKDNIPEIFHHDLIMASIAITTAFFDEKIGYIDDLPFINVKRDVRYPTWLMSSDVGGIKGEVLLRFRKVFSKVDDFQYLLNAIAKTGQQNGLFCYSEPALVKEKDVLSYTASQVQLFSFVFQFYKRYRAGLLWWCMYRYEQKWPISPFLKAASKRSFFKHKIDLSGIRLCSSKEISRDRSIDVILPTMGRPGHALNVLEDLKKQSLLPQNVIIVEQDPDPESSSELEEIYTREWPFSIKHSFTHKTGACRARNLCLQQVSSSWVFFCDDDNRFGPDLLHKALRIADQYGAEVLNSAYRSPSEKILYDKPKQWGTFGSGNAFILAEKINKLRFDLAFEYGFKEDMDFGMQLRNFGLDIIFHPDLEITHLKAPMGGFRTEIKKPWEDGGLQPKPSPTVMVYAIKHYTRSQLLGYKNLLWLKFYGKQEIKDPFKYISHMKARWGKSENWAKNLMSAKSPEDEV